MFTELNLTAETLSPRENLLRSNITHNDIVKAIARKHRELATAQGIDTAFDEDACLYTLRIYRSWVPSESMLHVFEVGIYHITSSYFRQHGISDCILTISDGPDFRDDFFVSEFKHPLLDELGIPESIEESITTATRIARNVRGSMRMYTNEGNHSIPAYMPYHDRCSPACPHKNADGFTCELYCATTQSLPAYGRPQQIRLKSCMEHKPNIRKIRQPDFKPGYVYLYMLEGSSEYYFTVFIGMDEHDRYGFALDGGHSFSLRPDDHVWYAWDPTDIMFSTIYE